MMAELALDNIIKVSRFTLRDIYGDKSFHKHVEANEKYKYVFGNDTEEARLAGKNLIEITITGIRSGVAFYTIEGHTEKEFHFDTKSAMAGFLEPVNPDMELLRELIELRLKRAQFLNGDSVSLYLD